MKWIRFAGLGVALCLPVEAQAAPREIRLADPSELAGALVASEGGDVLLLAGGDWGRLEIVRRDWPEGAPLVLRSADPADPPRFSTARVALTGNVVLDGLVFDYDFTPGDPPHLRPFEITNSRGVTLRDALFDGDDAREMGPASDGFPTAFGLSITGSSDVVLEDSEIRGFFRGLVVSKSDSVIVRGNDLHGIRMDGMNFAQVRDVLIEANHIHDFERSLESGDHADMIQFWTNRTEAPSVGITIRDNLLNSGQGWYTQSIFMRNDQVDRGIAGREMFYRDVLIEGNFILNAHLHGITVGETDGLSIIGNTVVRNPRSEGEDDNPGLWTPQIRVQEGSTNVRIAGNVTSKIGGWEEQPDWIVDGNFFVQDRTRMEPNFYGTVFVGGDPTAPASFAPRPGGPLDGVDLGARLR
ncbi:right-handed parallel beta-helix repeat-containing protein [Rubellimicrobium aerolatum]|uniref:Right-handed parallel beta-helix repeat-containing protein n=1 Tax=Rubellimicrobium aerolatum TaxID=490979 RepID=A0ABW0S9E7_9RHOB|nr:right-handed parallel beta-helix repeat-containing protein [Rubellimicrobium aerolatum]MBP1804923.1 hypothetical protein [Rubellimicrobium aerolatum]